MRHRGIHVMLLFGLVLLCPARALAVIGVYAWEDSPIDASSYDGALAVVRLALGERDFHTLAGARSVYRFSFESGAQIAAQLSVSEEAAAYIGGYFEKDIGQRHRYTVHINNDWIRGDVEKGIEKQGEAWNRRPEEERNRLVQFALRLNAATIIAHEGKHAVQARRSEVGFGPRLAGKEIHEKLAHDRYDEQAGYAAGREVLPRLQQRLTDELQGQIRDQAVGDANEHYARIPARFLIVRSGAESEGRAPFPWPSEGSADQKSYNTFLSGLADLASGEVDPAQPAPSAGPQPATGDGETGDPGDDAGAPPEPMDPEEQRKLAEQLFGDGEAAGLVSGTYSTMEEVYAELGIEYRAGVSDQAMAKSASSGALERRDFGEDPTAQETEE